MSGTTPVEVSRGLLISYIALLTSFIVGGLVHKILKELHQLKSGDTFFAGVMLFGSIPLLIAAGILVVGQHRAVHSTAWATTFVLGLSLIVLSFGYFEVYTW